MADEVQAATPEPGAAPQVAPERPVSRDERNSVEYAAQRIAGLFGAEEPTETPRDEPDPPSDDAAEPDSTVETEVEETDDEAGSKSEDKPDDADEAEPELPSTLDDIAAAFGMERAALDAVKVPVKVNGNAKEVTLAEAIAGYQKGEDYTLKTQELAEAKQEFSAQAERVEAELRSRAERFSILTGMLEKQLSGDEPNWQRLRAESPEKYLLAKDDWEQRQSVLTNAVAERDRLARQQQEQQQAKMKEFVEAERQKMVTSHPELADPDGPVAKKAISYLQERGFSRSDISGLVDSRMIDVVLDAVATWETRQATPEKKLLKPKPTRTVKPGAKANGVDAKADRLAAARRNHKKNPKDLHAAAARLEALLSS